MGKSAEFKDRNTKGQKYFDFSIISLKPRVLKKEEDKKKRVSEFEDNTEEQKSNILKKKGKICFPWIRR